MCVINDWIKSIIIFDDILKIELFFTEGYDQHFEIKRIDHNEFISIIQREFLKYQDIPSLLFELS